MIEGCKKLSWENRYMTAHGGAIEDFSAIPAGINEMMLQSHEKVIRLFPCWPKNKDARFVNLRGYGAFLISSEMRDGEVTFIEIKSEKGKNLTIELPWNAAIKKNGQEYGSEKKGRTVILTNPGDVFELIKMDNK